MRRLRRIVSLLAIFAVAWTALWPLVSSAHAAFSSEPVMLCHQAGMDVSPDEAPTQSSTPGSGKTHCPLCIMAFYVAFVATPPVPPFLFSTVVVTADRDHEPLLSRFESRLPPSRAPPSLLS